VQDAYGVLSRAAVKRSYDATLQIATNQAKAASVASAAKHANPMRGENVLKNVAFSRPASDWTGTREKYRHETWQGLSLNVKKAQRAAPLYSFPGVPQFAVRVGLPIAIAVGVIGAGVYYTVGRGGVERMDEQTRQWRLELTGKTSAH
jgi:hypothetical protein